MKKVKTVTLVSLTLGILISLSFLFARYLRPKTAAILIESTPGGVVFVNGEQVGRTPYEGKLKPAEIRVKLVPESFDQPLAPYETKVTLVRGIKTVIRRTFGDSEETSSGEVLSFEKTGAEGASLSVVSIPDASQISLDGQIRGFTPLKISTVSPHQHQLALTASGYLERKLNLETINGYRLTAIVKLAINPEASPSATTSSDSESEDEEDKPEDKKEVLVEILSTPTGFLRVREEPSTLADEIARVKPGERYKLLETDEKTGWFKIEYDEEKEGWVTNQYAKKVEGSAGTPTASPSATPKASPTKTPTPKPSSTPTP